MKILISMSIIAIIIISTIITIKKIKIRKEYSRIQNRKHEIINMLNTRLKTIFYINAKHQAIQSMLKSWDDFQIEILKTFQNDIYATEKLNIEKIYRYTIQMINLAIYLTYSQKNFINENQSTEELSIQYYKIRNDIYQDEHLIAIKKEIETEFQKEQFNPEKSRQMIIAYQVTKLNFQNQNENFFKVALGQITPEKIIKNLNTANETDPTVIMNMANETIKEVNATDFKNFKVTSNQDAYYKLLTWLTEALSTKQEREKNEKTALQVAMINATVTTTL